MSTEDLKEARRGRPPGSLNKVRRPEDDNAASPRTRTDGLRGPLKPKRTFKGFAMKTGGAYIGSTHGAGLGAAAGAVAGMVAGAPLSALGIKNARLRSGLAGAAVGSVVGTLAGGKYGWKAGSFLHSRTGQERVSTFREHIENIGGESMLIEEEVQLAEAAMAIDLSEEALVESITPDENMALTEALLPLAARFDIIDAQLSEGVISEEEAGRQKGGLLKNVAKVGAGLAAAGALGYGGMKAFQAADAGNLGDTAKKAADTLRGAAEKAGDMMKAGADAAAPHVQAATDKAGEVTSTAQTVAQDVADAGGKFVDDAAPTVQEYGEKAKDAISNAYDNVMQAYMSQASSDAGKITPGGRGAP